jgi:hypothetical protein
MGVAGRFARLFAQGAALAFGQRPRSRIELVGFGAFVLAWLIATWAYALHDSLRSPAPRIFMDWVPWVHAGIAAARLLAGWIAARVLRRPQAWTTLAALAAIAAIPWTALDLERSHWLADLDTPAAHVATWGIVGLAAVVAMRMAWVVGVDATRARRLVAGVVFAALLALPWRMRTEASFWFVFEDEEAPAAVEAPVVDDDPPEVVLGRQPALVAARLDRLAPQAPGAVDLYAVGFAGDGSEGVFRNEVEFLERLLPQRFGARDHFVPLVNSPGTTDTVPLATLANLRTALAGIGTRIDRDEDVVLLFLTSHGSADHELYVDLEPLPLVQVTPGDLRRALDDAGIRWRVVVVSACYSGGFIDALRSPETLVITAARADRTSFGCGSDSDITYFGRAFLTEALNRTTDFREAHALAAQRIGAWEREEKRTPSEPQLWAGARIDAKLAQWRAGVVPGAPVAFAPLRKVEAR